MASTDEWYWCFDHQKAERAGEQCRATNRLGPYPSEEAARNWQAINEAREETWEQQDEEWEGKGRAAE
jgi:hypothetical protein